MNLPITVTQEDLLEILINVAPIRPVFIWGAPGIGKSALVEQFAKEVGLPCVSHGTGGYSGPCGDHRPWRHSSSAGCGCTGAGKRFPLSGPILIITDGYIEDDLKVRREHAYLIPNGNRLPFRAKGKVFYMENRDKEK